MTKADGRMGRLARELSARERVLLLHQALIEDRTPDPQIRATTPREQYAECNRLVALANHVIHTLLMYSLTLAADVEGHRMRFTALLALFAWSQERQSWPLANGEGSGVPEELFPVTAPPTFEPDAKPTIDDVARKHAWTSGADSPLPGRSCARLRSCSTRLGTSSVALRSRRWN